MLKTTTIRSAGVFLLSWSWVLPQERPQENTDVEFIQIEKHEIPKYFIVQTFFEVLHFCYTRGDFIYHRAILPLGIIPGSEAEEALTEAMFHTKVLSERRRDMRPYVNAPKEVFDRVKYNFIREKVLALREIYQRLISELEAGGVSVAHFEAMIDEGVRPSIGMASRPGFPTKLFEIASEFEVP